MKEISENTQTCLAFCIQVGKELYKRFDRRLAALGLTPVQEQVLSALADSESLSMHELSERLCCVGSNVTAIIGRMAEAGLVARQAATEDARIRRVHITTEGKRLLAKATAAPHCCPELATLLTPREWTALYQLLEKVWARLQTEG